MTQTAEPQTTIARRAYNPLAPIGNSSALKGLLETQSRSIAATLPKHVTPERLIKTMLVAANRTPLLLECTQASLLETVNRAAELGLDLSGTLGECYPVPFKNKVKDEQGRDLWVYQCTLIIGYRGFAKLARQSGEIKRIDADIVCANDDFTYQKGSGGKCIFKPNLRSDRGEVIGAYAYVEFKDGGEQFDFMTEDDIEKIRLRSKSGSVQKDNEYGKKGDPIGAWKTDRPEMAKKTVFRRLAKWLPMSTEKFVEAMDHDNEDFNLSEVLEVTPVAQRGTKALKEELKNRQLPEQQQTTGGDSSGDTNIASTPSAAPSTPQQSAPDGTGAPSAGDRKEGGQTAERQEETKQEPPKEAGPVTPWEALNYSLVDLAESRGCTDAAKVRDTALKQVPTKKRKQPATMTKEECDAVMASAKLGGGFWSFIEPRD